MEPKGETGDSPEGGSKQVEDTVTGVDTAEEQDVKPPVATEVDTASVAGDVADCRANACSLADDGSRSPLSFATSLCPAEGLAGRIGLVELGKGSESENGKACISTVSPPNTQPACSSADGCVGSENSGDTLVPTGNIDHSNVAEAVTDVEPKAESDITTVRVNVDNECVNEMTESVPAMSEGIDKGPPCAKESVNKGCDVREGSAMQPGVSGCDVGVKDGCAGDCGPSREAEGSPCVDSRAKKRRVEDRGSDVEACRVEGDQWRKRRKRKSRRKAPNASPSSASSSGDERTTTRRPQHKRKPAAEEAVASEDEQQFCLRWNNFLTNITSQFGTLRDDEDFVDVTLACGGMHVKAHRVVLSACSPYFKRMFKSVPYCQHPVVFLEGIHPSHLLSLLAFMYCGEVGVGRGQLPSLLSAAHALQIRGLTEMGSTANGSARSGEEGDDDEEKVILSARRQAMAVEKVLKDIGFSEVEGRRGGCVMNLPKSSTTRGDRASSSSTARQKAGEAKALVADGTGLSNGLGEAVGSGSDVAVPVPAMPEPNGEDAGEPVRLVERRKWSGITAKRRLGSPSQQSLVPAVAELDAPSATHCARKGLRDAGLLNCGVSSEDSATRVNSHRPETLLMCDMAASLVDVHLESSPVGEEDGRAKNLKEPMPRNSTAPSSPTPDAEGTGMERHGWDPGENGAHGPASHFEPRIDLVMGTELIKPKEEFAPFGSDAEDNVSLPNTIEPKMEYQEVSSQEEEGEMSSCGGVTLVPPGQPSLSLVSIGDQHQTYRPHILSSPIVGTLQQQPRPSPSSSSSHVYSHFLPPMSGTAVVVPQHGTSRLSPGIVPTLVASAPAGERRGSGDTAGGSGHLKWEMPRPCPVCRRIYSNNSNLRRHLRTIHEDYYETHMQ